MRMANSVLSVVCLLALLVSSASLAQDKADKPDASKTKPAKAEQVPIDPKADGEPGANVEPKVAKPKSFPLNQRSHGIRLNQKGKLVGVTTTIDPNTLELVSEAHIDVIFIQQGRIVGQTRSDARGHFEISGLTANAVYSVVARSANQVSNGLYSTFAIAVFPSGRQEVAVGSPRTQFTSLLETNQDGDELANNLTLTLIPARDLALIGLPQAFPAPLVPGISGRGGGGGGGTGGVGGVGAFGAAAAAAAASSTSRPNAASPFAP